MKRFFIKDEDTGEETVLVEEEQETLPMSDDDGPEGLTQEDIMALKDLVKAAPKLIALVSKDDVVEDADEDEDVEEEEEVEEEIDEDVEEDDEMEEEDEEDDVVIDTDMTRDSKKSVGSLENKKVNDSSNVEDDKVSDAWAKRFGGK